MVKCRVYLVRGRRRELTLAALGVMSSFISFPSSSFCGLYAAWVYRLVGVRKAVNVSDRPGPGGSRLLRILHVRVVSDISDPVERSLAAVDGLPRNRGFELVAMARLRGNKKSRTG